MDTSTLRQRDRDFIDAVENDDYHQIILDDDGRYSLIAEYSPMGEFIPSITIQPPTKSPSIEKEIIYNLLSAKCPWLEYDEIIDFRDNGELLYCRLTNAVVSSVETNGSV